MELPAEVLRLAALVEVDSADLDELLTSTVAFSVIGAR